MISYCNSDQGKCILPGKQTSKLFWVMQNYHAWYVFYLLSHLTVEEQLWKWMVMSGTLEPQRTGSASQTSAFTQCLLLCWFGTL